MAFLFFRLGRAVALCDAHRAGTGSNAQQGPFTANWRINNYPPLIALYGAISGGQGAKNHPAGPGLDVLAASRNQPGFRFPVWLGSCMTLSVDVSKSERVQCKGPAQPEPELNMKFDHILFPTDFSERSVALNEQVEWLADRFGSRVTLLHVLEIPATWYGASEASLINIDCFDALRDSAEQRLKKYAIKVPESRLERITAEGDVAGHIIDVVNEGKVDLVVMGTHGYGALQGWILGSVTAKVLHNANCPVWTDSLFHARRNHRTISSMLCGIELVDEAVSLLRFTSELAQSLGANVRLVHSVPELQTRPNKYFDFDLHRYLTESARVDIAKVQREAGTEFPLTVSGLGISHALAEAASEREPDLVVIGRGKAQKSWGRFQTHAYEIIRYAPCPVLSYSLNQQGHISSSCNAEHLGQCAEDAQLLTGSPKP